jgi:hypothetical protein
MSEILTWSVMTIRLVKSIRRRSERTNPNQISSVESYSVAAPDVLRVELGDVNILDDNVLRSVGNAETLATDHTLATDTDDRLVGA